MSSYTVNMPIQAAWLVYINGLEIPVCSLSVQYGVWQMPTLTLNMVPHNIIARIGAEDRLQVAIFYLDHHWDPGSPTFCLLGEFETVGWSYNNTPRGRFINLSCVSPLQIFEQLHFFYISSLDDIATKAGGVTATDPSVASSVKVLYPTSLFLEGLTSPSGVGTGGEGDSNSTGGAGVVDTDNFIKRPIDFVLNIFRSLLKPVSQELLDVTHVAAHSKLLPRSASSIPGKNFFARWLKMTGFHERWAALPYFEDEGGVGCFPLIKAAQDTNTLPALQQQIGQSVGNAGSAWELLQKVLGYMYMEIYAMPAPPAALTMKGTGNIVERGSLGSTANARKTIPTYFVKPMCTFALPPACNVIFPSMVTNYSFQENYIRQPTRVYLGEQFISNVIAAPTASPSMVNFVQNLMVTGYPLAVRKRMKDLLEASPETTNKNFLLFAEEFYKGPVSRRMNAPPWMYLLQQMENVNNKPGKEATVVKKKIAALVDGDIEAEMAASPLGALFDTYAKAEYYRSRYAERSGGVALQWNPYITPGFPVAVFDQRSAGFDTVGYANSLSHQMSAAGGGTMSTSVNLTFMRTLPETIGLTPTASDEVALDIGPAEAIPEVRDNFQTIPQAHALYRRLFYQERPMKKSAVFDWKAMLNIVRDDGYIIEDPRLYNAEGEIPWFNVQPKPEYEGLFEGYDAAMRYASRPACTLQEYITTWHGRSLDALLDDGTVRGEYTSFYSPTNDDNRSRGAVFWGRIYKLVQGPGPKPDVSVSNVGGSPDYASAGSTGWRTVDQTTGMPQTRENWDKRLEEYRKIVRSEDGRIAPQD